MPRRHKWIAIACSLALLIAFSVSTGSVHAAGNTRQVQLHSSIREMKLIPNGGPPGCPAYIRIASDAGPNITYHGSTFYQYITVYGWYVQLPDGNYAYCSRIVCTSYVTAVAPSTFPPGNLGAECGNIPLRTKWSNGGKADYFPVVSNVDAGYWPACATYQPAGAGTPYRLGWGCLPGDVQLDIPLIIYAWIFRH